MHGRARGSERVRGRERRRSRKAPRSIAGPSDGAGARRAPPERVDGDSGERLQEAEPRNCRPPPRPHAPPPKHVAALHPRAPQSVARELLAFFLSRRNAAAVAPREISVACHWGCVGEAGCVRVRPCGARPWERGPRGSSHAARKVGDEDARRNHTRFAIPFLNQAYAPPSLGQGKGKRALASTSAELERLEAARRSRARRNADRQLAAAPGTATR